MSERKVPWDDRFVRAAGVEVPVICGAMYPCSNPELVAAVSEAGGLGVVQPISLSYVHGRDFRAGMERIRELTKKPVGLNVLTEKSLSKVYRERMERYVDEALDVGVRFFVTALGNPRWVVDRVASSGGIVYHDCVDRKWAEKGLEGGVHGLIAVNDRAGGHAGRRPMEALVEELSPLGVPVVCAGGIGDGAGFVKALSLGYAGVQMGTRFIATPECLVHADYKEAIVKAGEEDVVLTERITGVPVSVLRTPYVERVGTTAGPLGRFLLRGRTTKHWARAFYAIRSVRQLKQGLARSGSSSDYWQAGRSVAAIRSVEPAGEIVRSLAAALASAG